MQPWFLIYPLAFAKRIPVKKPLGYRKHCLKWPLLILLGLFASSGFGATPVPSQQEPSDNHAYILLITHHQDQRWLSLADIETLPLYDVELEHPEGLEGRFTGVWLNAFLEHQGIPQDKRIRLIAHDDYTIFLSPSERDQKRYLLVTRLNGQPLNKQQLGPLLLVVPADAESVIKGTSPHTRWIWSIRELRYS
ncbi:hypothetical protein GLV89_10770 [Halomonas alkaliantarctica]|nr:hypothetical protein [Halomonas alkaliantarctica]